MKHLDTRVTSKVADVEREDALNAVNVHGSDEPRVHIARARGNDPSFNQTLFGDTHPAALPEEELHCFSSLCRGGMRAVNSPQADVRIDETIHSYHLSSRP